MADPPNDVARPSMADTEVAIEDTGAVQEGVNWIRSRFCGAATGLCDAVAAAIEVAPDELRGKRPSSSTWSVNAYICHLAQASEVILIRVKMIAEQDQPLLPYHQQDEAVEAAGGDQVPAEQSLGRLSQTVSKFRTYLEAIPAAGWKRIGRHALAGEITLSDVAHDMPHELEHHARDIERIAVTLGLRP